MFNTISRTDSVATSIVTTMIPLRLTCTVCVYHILPLIIGVDHSGLNPIPDEERRWVAALLPVHRRLLRYVRMRVLVRIPSSG
jgi:uncharacterized protein (DUF2342 family)